MGRVEGQPRGLAPGLGEDKLSPHPAPSHPAEHRAFLCAPHTEEFAPVAGRCISSLPGYQQMSGHSIKDSGQDNYCMLIPLIALLTQVESGATSWKEAGAAGRTCGHGDADGEAGERRGAGGRSPLPALRTHRAGTGVFQTSRACRCTSQSVLYLPVWLNKSGSSQQLVHGVDGTGTGLRLSGDFQE